MVLAMDKTGRAVERPTARPDGAGHGRPWHRAGRAVERPTARPDGA